MKGRRGLREGIWLVAAWVWLTSLASTAAAAVPCEASKLDNGLRVYCCTDARMGGYVAVRLVVFPPPCLPGSPEYRAFQTLTHSMFQSETEADDLFEFLYKTPSASGLTVGYHRAVFSFDIPPAQLDSLFTRIARQWQTGLQQTQIDCGQEDMGGIATGGLAPAIERLVLLADCDWKETLEAKSVDVAAMFRSHMSARNMSLILAGSKANVDRAMRLAKRLERIPAAEGSTMPRADYGEAFRGRITWPDGGPWAIGLRIPVPRDADPAVGHFYFAALLCKLNDVLSLRKGLLYGLPGSVFLGAGEHVMVFEPYVDEDVVDYNELAEEVERVAAEMADSATMSWWRTYTEGKRKNNSRFWAELSDASTVANVLTDLVMYAHMEGREEIANYYLPTADEALSGFAGMLETTEWFIVEPPLGWSEILSEFSDMVIGYVYGDLFGPTDDKRALAVMCQCALVLIVLRGLERRMERGRPTLRLRGLRARRGATLRWWGSRARRGGIPSMRRGS